jgi:SAM-dependent methyltransferase
MYEFHGDKERYFDMQRRTAAHHILPFCASEMSSGPWRVLEIGCSEAGVLKAFTDAGHIGFGIELDENRLVNARKFMAAELAEGKVQFLNKNIYNVDVENDLNGTFDLIILKDVIEHIPNQEVFIPMLKNFLRPEGKIFFGFPPWQMPFGGHQQMNKSKVLARMPYYHLLPKRLYQGVMKLFQEDPQSIEHLLEIKETGISIERFERIVKKDYKILKRTVFFTNPIYEYKFGIKPKKQLGIVANTPYLRNFLSTCTYYLITA